MKFFTFIFNFSLANFSNAFTFKNLNDDDIASVERLIQNKMLEMLEKNLHESVLENQTEHDAEILIEDETLKEYFGDVYYNDPHNFEFLRGDRKFISLLVEHVQKTVDAKGENKGLRNYKPKSPRKQQNPKSTRTKHKIQANKECVKPADEIDGSEFDGDSTKLIELKSSLFSKVMDYMRIYKVNEIVDLENVPESIVSVSTQNESIHGHVYCIICQNDSTKRISKPKRVSYNVKNGSWISSNLSTHLQVVHKLKPTPLTHKNAATKKSATQNKNAPNKRPQSSSSVDSVCTESVIIEENASEAGMNKRPKLENLNNAVCSNTQQIWYDQISKQVTAMSRTAHKNCEQQTDMQFFIDATDSNSLSTIKVVNSSPDGNCMLSSSAHQISHHKMNSSQLKTVYKKMRADAVKHIKENYASFQHAIRGHVYDIQDEKKRVQGEEQNAADIDKECLFFLNQCLPQNRCWTGTETMTALSIVYEVNIVVINENGPINLPSSSDKIYAKTILLAYRLDQSTTELRRNHYDSVTDIPSDVVYSIAETLSKL